MLAPSRSILFKNPILGILNLFAYFHTISVCVYTPDTASKTVIAPSSTLKLLSTSAVKSI